MNSTSNNLTATTVNTIIQEAYASNIYNWLFLSSTILAFYAALLKLSQDIEYVWSKMFSLPTWLYIFARYGTLAVQVLTLLINFEMPGRTCNILATAGECMQLLAFGIGVQGLLLARAYTLCERKFPTIALTFGFLVSTLILRLCEMIVSPGCISSLSTGGHILALSGNICIIFTDVFVFGICVWNVWGIWKLKRETGIQSARSIVSVLITQSILRCCFVVVITIAGTVLVEFMNSSAFFRVLSLGFTLYQNVMSSILVADFTLDLRSLNSAKIEASNASLPPLQFSNVLQHIHQSLVVELATPEDIVNVEGGGDREPESMEGSDIQPAQD